MSNLVTDWRKALTVLLAEEFPDADVIKRIRDGMSRDKDRIAVFWQRTPIDANVNYGRPRMTIRYFAKMPKVSPALKDAEPDDEPLEQAAWDLSTVLMPVRTTLVTNLYFELSDIAPNRATFSVDVLLSAYIQNPASLPA